MRMFRKVLLTFGLLLLAEMAALAQGTMKGVITDAKTKEPLPFANVIAKQDGKQILVGVSDFDGVYTIKPLPVGKYDLEVRSVGYATVIRQGIQVKASGFTVTDVEMKSEAQVLDALEIVEEKVCLVVLLRV
ncbi:MAG: carboxypeptidase-like regulatory domain-containing protein [Bacteroidales bacterium]|nr:carboxypeptidase-like regulatory domain-containing protein [Bacteroidales bacterium]